MPARNTLVRSLHDLGAAAWFGGSLMGALGVNGAAAEVRDPTDRARVAAAGLLLAHQDRVRDQAGVTANTTLKCILTGVALATTAYSGVLGAKVARGDDQPTHGATEPALGTCRYDGCDYASTS